jgi:hypothetical protein
MLHALIGVIALGSLFAYIYVTRTAPQRVKAAQSDFSRKQKSAELRNKLAQLNHPGEDECKTLSTESYNLALELSELGYADHDTLNAVGAAVACGVLTESQAAIDLREIYWVITRKGFDDEKLKADFESSITAYRLQITSEQE